MFIFCSLLCYGFSGKIACTSGHSSWISSKLSRNKVFDLRGRSDAVIVGGNTVRLDGIALLFLMDYLLLHCYINDYILIYMGVQHLEGSVHS